LEELHLSDHVQNVPGQHFWDWENVRQSSNEEAEALLRDVHSTHQALKEQIELYDKNARHSPKELLYDIVADDPDHIYDAVADTVPSTRAYVPTKIVIISTLPWFRTQCSLNGIFMQSGMPDSPKYPSSL
uniref:Ferritin n=1 Tax=Heligmosomoides polygyrus TaxID=6339 RepID=A0A183GVR2_HELPZ